MSTALMLALATNLGVAAVGWLALGVLSEGGVDYNFMLWAVPVVCLWAVTAGLGAVALLDQSWRRSGIGILSAVPLAIAVELGWLFVHVLEVTNGG